jgi:uncharacterized protein (DUF1330 family)
MPKAYFVATYRSVSNPDALAEYAKLAGPAMTAAGGRFLARGNAAKAYEKGVLQRVVVIEFDSVEKAVAAHDSPGYQAALKVLGNARPHFRSAPTSRVQLHCKRTSSTSSAGLPKRRAADTHPCDASWPGPSWPRMSLDRYTQSTLNVARHAKKSEVEGEIESQIEYQEVQEGQASSAAQAAEGCCQHSGAGGCCNESSRLRRQARSRRSGVKRRRGATSF